jgi:hypothetical protein
LGLIDRDRLVTADSTGQVGQLLSLDSLCTVVVFIGEATQDQQSTISLIIKKQNDNDQSRSRHDMSLRVRATLIMMVD